MDWFFPESEREKDNDIRDGGHETDPSTGSDSDSATHYPTPLRPQFLTGMARDLKRRLPYYLDDWKLSPPLTPIIVNASLLSFVRQLIPSLIFAGWLELQTNGQLSAVEVLMSTGMVGTFYALFSGQPLVLVGVSGPVALLLGASHGLATTIFHADFFAFFWWMCIWTSILHILTACFGLVNLSGLITPFTSQIFELFVAISFIYKSIHDMVHPFLFVDFPSDEDKTKAYSSLIIAILTFMICWKLHFAGSWIYFTRNVRGLMASYNLLIAILIATCLSYIPDFSKSAENEDIIKRIDLFSSSPYDWNPSTNRNWLEITPLSGIDTRGIFGALIPGVMLYILFFMEHNMCSAIVQAPKHKLKKPSAYHWDFFVLGLSTIACGFLGLPPCCGVVPQAPMHTRSLCTKKKDEQGNEYIVRCTEQRWSPLLQAGLMFAALCLSGFLSKVPIGCLFGVLLYLGVDCMSSNGIWTRITLKFILPSRRPQIAIVTNVSSWDTVQRYTGVQVGLSLVAFGTVYFTDYDYLFPIILAAGVPIRKFIVDCIFQKKDLKHLDPTDMSEEKILKEHREMKEVLSPVSAAESDVFQRVHEFHHSNLVYDPDDSVPEDLTEDVQLDTRTSPRHQSPRHTRPSRLDEESGIPSPQIKRDLDRVQSLSKVTRRESKNADTAPTFVSSWQAWTEMFDAQATREWCGTGTVDDVLMKPDRDDELSIRKTKSTRSVKTEVYDADRTVKSMMSNHSRTSRRSGLSGGGHTRATNQSRTMRVVTPSAGELFDSDMMSLKSSRTSDLLASDIINERSRPKVRGLSVILGGEKSISPKSQRSYTSWRSDRSIRKYSDVERIRSNEQLDFDVDKVVIPESILKKNKSTRTRSAGRIAFASDAQTVDSTSAQIARQHTEEEEM